MIDSAFRWERDIEEVEQPEDEFHLGQAEYSRFVDRLIEEVDGLLRTDAWVLMQNESGYVHALCGAALWHTCVLLKDLDTLAATRREMALRIVSRAHLEAWLTGLYLHYGESEALDKLEADFKYTLEAQQHEADAYDRELAAEIKRAERKNRKIRRDNDGIRLWNESHPDGPPKPTLDEIKIPTRPAIKLDLHEAIERGPHIVAKSLSVQEMTHALTRLAEDKAPGDEHFGVIYTIGYRGASTIGTHLNVNLLGSYLRGEDRNFFRIAKRVGTPTYASTSSYSALPATALLAHRILARRACESTVAVEVLQRFEQLDIPSTIA